MTMDASDRAFLAQLSAILREAVGGKSGKMERKVIKVSKALEEITK